MNPFQEMLKKNTSSLHYKKMQDFASPLKDRFGINHFWYYKITLAGYYSYVGTHDAWNAYCADNSMEKHFACLRHPECLKNGINLMKASTDKEYQKVLQIAWEKFKVNFNINLINTIPEGIEAFGFATDSNDPRAEERLLGHLPALNDFIKVFKAEYPGFFHFLEETQVYLPSELSQKYYELPKTLIIPYKNGKLITNIGCTEILSLTARERDILKFIASGYPVIYIAARLNHSIKSIENDLSTIKYKLSCESEIELIHKAQKIESTNYFDL